MEACGCLYSVTILRKEGIIYNWKKAFLNTCHSDTNNETNGRITSEWCSDLFISLQNNKKELLLKKNLYGELLGFPVL